MCDSEFYAIKTEPILIVISGLSGVGKDAVVKRMKERNQPFHFVVTATSRARRDNEVEGVDYFFVTEEEFERMIAAGELLEHAFVYKKYKGIPKSQVRLALESGKDVIMRLDVQGAETIRTLCPEALLIFLITQNLEELKVRLRNRQTESEADFNLRIDTALDEMKHIPQFDYVVVNREGQLDTTADTIVSIILAEHHKVQGRKVTLI
jgi:guanylate kinase